MRLSQIQEGLSTNILVVDVQPAYDRWSKKIAPSVTALLNRQTGGKYVMYNGFNGKGRWTEDDTEQDVKNYLVTHGLDQAQIPNINFIEKHYGFFRSWMDNEVPEAMIIRTVRAMLQNGVKRSRELDFDEIFTKRQQRLGFRSFGIDVNQDEIFMPDFVSLALLKKISPFWMCGGGRTACLREIELICNTFNIRYKRIDSLIY